MNNKLKKLRTLMTQNNIDGFIIPTSDTHASEYVADYFKCREFISGFTGSAGTLVIGMDNAALWTDGRYFLQAADELSGSEIELMQMGITGTPSIEDWLIQNGIKRLGFDGRLISAAKSEELKKCGFEISSDLDLAGEVWGSDRPQLKPSKIFSLPISVTGKSVSEKARELQMILSERNIDALIITDLGETAWLTNLRGDDIAYTPVFYAYAVITMEKLTIFPLSEQRLDALIDDGKSDIEIEQRPYYEIFDFVSKMPRSSNICIDKKYIAKAMFDSLPNDCNILDIQSPIQMMKAIKNKVEISSTEKAHIRDGAAVTEFLAMIDSLSRAKAAGDPLGINEMQASDKLLSIRASKTGFIEPSFETITGFGPNGAVVHYTPKADGSAELINRGLLLVDSGGQYNDGTTDITRVITLGAPSEAEKRDYTLVLKSHIALSNAVFPKGTKARELDNIARKPLKDAGLDYAHGTGHGVGHIAGVHEGPFAITKNTANDPGAPAEEEILPNMVMSCEPGVYREGEYGIRLENLIVCKSKGYDNELCFTPITLCPFDNRLIITDMLDDHEKKWLNEYHAIVRDTLLPIINEDSRDFLMAQTEAL